MAAGPMQDLEILSELCVAAIATHGSDVGRIEEHVMRSIDALPAPQQQALKSAIASFLHQQKAINASTHGNALAH